MADKSIDQLNPVERIYASDLLVIQQSGQAKSLPGQVLLNWLTAAADGHGGIQSIQKVSTSGLVDTYRITLADTTTFDFVVTNGRSINSISKTSTSGLVDTYTISYNNGTTSRFTVTNGAKGDKGDNSYVWIKYASQKPTESSHSMGDIPDDWIGIYSGNASSAPSDWKQYKWFKHKGEKGDTGKAATLVTKSVTYQVSDSGTIIPSGAWGSSIPVVSQGKYLWTKTEVRFNTGDPIVSYSVARMGIDGTGAVSSVAGVSPDATGNVTLTAADVGALAVSGGEMTGEIQMNGQSISGLNDPTDDTQAARKGYVDTAKAEANAYTDASVRKAAPRNLLDNSDFRNPVNQRGKTSYPAYGYGIDRWKSSHDFPVSVNANNITVTGSASYHHFMQAIEKYSFLVGKTLTLAIRCKGVSGGTAGLAMIDSSNTIYGNTQHTLTGGWQTIVETVTIPGEISTTFLWFAVYTASALDVEWAALYEGEYTAETLPEYHPKGYGAELVECQRYYYRFQTYWKHVAIGFCTDANTAIFVIKLPQPMRVIPTMTISNMSNIIVRCGGGGAQVPGNITAAQANIVTDALEITATVTGATTGDAAVLYLGENVILSFSADL